MNREEIEKHLKEVEPLDKFLTITQYSKRLK